MRLPDFLIIGAMKAGTTTLYRDLLTIPDIFFPVDKEPENLVHDDVLTKGGRAAYAALFEKSPPDSVCGEASTAYSKLPDFPGVAKRALSVLGPDTKIIYIVRDPIQRALSHFRHVHTQSDAEIGAFDDLVRESPQVINYGKYCMQLVPWVERFGASVKVIIFEEYVASRTSQVIEVAQFLGLSAPKPAIDEGTAYNSSASKPIGEGPLGWVQKSLAYRRWLRPLVPAAARDQLRTALLPHRSAPSVVISDATREWLKGQFQDDVDSLKEILGRSSLPWMGQASLQ